MQSDLNLTGSIGKVSAALDILKRCIGEKGIWASPDRYRNTCWTRDLAYAIAPLLHEMGEHELVLNHLRCLSALQRPNGQIPMVFLDDEDAWVHDKEVQEKERGREPFMLKRYREGELWNLTPGTRDSEICYLLAVYEYVHATRDTEFLRVYGKNIAGAFRYIETKLMRNHLVIGCDWRDTMHAELGDKALLTNNALLKRLLHLSNRSVSLRNHAHAFTEMFASGRGYLDYVGNARPDPLGVAFFALTEGAHVENAFRDVLSKVDSPHGVTIRCRHKPGSYSKGDETAVIEATDGVVVWPFVIGSLVLAAIRHREYEIARDQFQKLHDLEGFWEWYDPRDGKGYGAREQLWSAALYLRAFFAMQKTGLMFY